MRRLVIGLSVLFALAAFSGAGALVNALYLASPRSQSRVAWFLSDRLGIDLNQYRVQIVGVSAELLDVWWHADRIHAPTLVVSRGVSLHSTPREYGENFFFVCYGDVLLGRFGQFKINRHEYHHYAISIARVSGDRVEARVSAEGPEETAFEPYKEGSYLSLSDRDDWMFVVDHCRRHAAEPRVAADGAAARR